MWQLDAIAVFALSILGLGLATRDICYMWGSLELKNDNSKDKPYFDKELASKIEKAISAPSDPVKLNVVIKDYEVCQAEIVRRDNSTLIIGSIFTTASLLILANAISQGFQHSIIAFAFASIMLYLLWLFIVHRTSNKLDDITYKRIHTIEEALTNRLGYQFGIHSYVFLNTHKNGKTLLWVRRRRMFWGIILMLISFAWLLLSLTILLQSQSHNQEILSISGILME